MWFAVLLYSTGRAQEAVAHARHAVELDPVSTTASRILAQSLQAAGQIEAAVEEYRETTMLGPQSSFEWLELSRALMDIGQHDEALATWVNAVRLGGYDVQAATDAFQAAIRYQRTGEAQTVPDFAFQLQPLVWLYSRAGRGDRALQLFEEFIRQGAYGLVAFNDALGVARELVDDPRYVAVLQEAGVTW
jgi:predicted TPR repeat methyltransferase